MWEKFCCSVCSIQCQCLDSFCRYCRRNLELRTKIMRMSARRSIAMVLRLYKFVCLSLYILTSHYWHIFVDNRKRPDPSARELLLRTCTLASVDQRESEKSC